ncbi:ABC transporter permease [Anaeromicropila herbilytica]|uniref:ABC transporter permease n=1 Tax=Anaeromicropila herbilytica TaxID=2785025 RepID=A0A7R7ICE6_9FIRM|nr:ABC transporter permease [Anaeromicropila herbilytica]BCN28868.1 ABC transporter permease [Anaeromicropila herbilytica]
MGKFFYSKLAITNLKHNKNAYVPYMLACIGIIFTYFLFSVIGNNEGMKNVSGQSELSLIIRLGQVVVGIFSVIFILYANSFLMKRRKKELGLYGILGLEKRHVSYVMFYETLFMSVVNIGIGLIFGVVFGKLVFLGLLKILKTAGDSTFVISASSVVNTVIFFAILFLIDLVINYVSVHVANPIALLKGGDEGEKEPKTQIIWTLIGVACMAAGYYKAMTVASSVDAITQFFIAVLFVIAGTFLLFMSGSVALLKLLKKNKKLYYQPNNFISISSMIYRMKQNAAGLASICILSTMVLVTASTTIALYMGEEDALREMSPFDITVSAESAKVNDEYLNKLSDLADKNDITVTKTTSYNYIKAYEIIANKKVKKMSRKYSMSYLQTHACGIKFITIEQYNKMIKGSKQLNEKEAIMLNPTFDYKDKTLTIGNETLSVKATETYNGLPKQSDAINRETYIVLNQADLQQVIKELEQIDSDGFKSTEQFDLFQTIKGSRSNRLQYGNDISEWVKTNSSSMDSIDVNRETMFKLYGGLLFIGVFLSLLFLLATVLIIYFKQVSEGFSDRKRFVILRKVGMDQKAIKQTINKQIIMVFFLPLVTAVIHIAFAFKMICMMLQMFYLTNTDLFVKCTIGTILVFSVIYVAVYLTTAKVYYKVVNEEN